MYYDSNLHYSTKKNIRTIVVYSSDINEAVTELNRGTIDYKIEAFYMSTLDGDKKLEALKTKVLNKEELTEDGLEKGIGKGKCELLIKQLIKKFKVLPDGLARRV